MAQWSFALGKGFKETEAPFRQVYVYGVPLNSPSIDVIHGSPALIEPTTVFSLEGLPGGVEMVLALLYAHSVWAGDYSARFRWYRSNSAIPIYEVYLNRSMPVNGPFAAYSFIGHVPWEINNPGTYTVRVDVTGPEPFSSVLTFQVTGPAAPIVAPPPSVPVLSGLAAAFQSASSWLYQGYLTVHGWVWPFWLLGEPLYQLSALFTTLAGISAELTATVNELVRNLANALSWDGIQGLLRAWLPGLEGLVSWFTDWWSNVYNLVGSWWLGAQGEVRSWIAAGTQGLSELRAGWDNFQAIQLPELVSFSWLDTWWNDRLLDLQVLIDTAFTTRESLWSGWDQLRDKVTGLFRDPEAWLLDKIETMLARFW